MNKLTNKQSQILKNINRAISIDLELLEEYLEEGRKDMVRHSQHAIREKLYGIRTYLIVSDDSKGNRNWNAIKDEYRAILDMPILGIQVWLDLLKSDKAVSEEEYKLANA